MTIQNDQETMIGDKARNAMLEGIEASPGLYKATKNPMYNADTGQHFTAYAPLKVTADQLQTAWFKMQLFSGNIEPADPDTAVEIPDSPKKKATRSRRGK